MNGQGPIRDYIYDRVSKLYPFCTKDAELWNTTPKVDTSLQRLAHYITLPLEDLVSFKDPMDCRIDTDLKRMYTVAGAACRPAITLTLMAAALRVWIAKLEAGSSGEVVGAGGSSHL